MEETVRSETRLHGFTNR